MAEDIDRLYREGSRMLIITDGEPYFWRDGRRNLDSAIEYAKMRGFFRIVVGTNGPFPLVSKANYL